MSLPQLTPEELANTPSAMPPPGVESNFINPESRSPGATAAISVMLAVTLIFLLMRLYSRAKISKQLGADDWSAILAGIFTTAIVALSIAAFNIGGLGPHAWDVPLIDIFRPAFNQTLFAIQILGLWANFFAKLSILFFLLRIFPIKIRPYIAYAAYFGIMLNILFNVVLTLYTCIECAPRPGSGGQNPVHCRVYTRTRIGASSAAVNAFLDIYILCISLPTLWALQMPTRRKLGVALILSTGALACVCSILTLYFRAHYADPEDSTWVQVEVITVGVFEPLVAIITSCLPSMPALWVSVSAHGFTSFRHLISHFSTTNLTRSNRSEQGSYELYDRFDGQRSASARSLNIKGGGFDLEHGVTTHNASTPQSNHQIAHGS